MPWSAAFEGMKSGFGHFIAQFASYKMVYGTFASLPIFLVWVYLSWVVVVFAAVITAVLPYWRSGGVNLKHAPGGQFVEALQILGMLYRAYQDGTVLNLQQLRIAVRISWEQAEAILEKLESAGWVAKLQGNGWVLARDASAIRLNELYQAFVFSREAGDATEEGAIRRVVTDAAAVVDDTLDLSLKDLFSTATSRRTAKVA
jgi:membrane protein